MIQSTIKIRHLLSFLLLVVCCHIRVIGHAQNSNEIKGQVIDENGKPIANVTVLAKSRNTGQTATTQTDSSGSFAYSGLPAAGSYSLVASHVGYQTQTVSGYNIATGSNTPLVIQLRSTANDLKEVIVTGRAGAQ
ncbi:MAG TPA: carboxypeptidase-like regulatory domain-containing protein, partial [Niabella sp.]